MAGMFYSLKETAKKLNITEKEVKELIKQDKLREFRIGSDSLLKAEEVEALAAEKGISIEPKVQAEEKAASEAVAPETAELQTGKEEIAEPEAGEIELGDFELPESEAVEPESPVLDMAELENLNIGKEVPAYRAGGPEVKTEKFTAVKPKADLKKQRSRAKRKVARTSSRPRLSIGQWFWKGLMEDNPGAVILLFLLLGGIIIGCLALGTVLYDKLGQL